MTARLTSLSRVGAPVLVCVVACGRPSSPPSDAPTVSQVIDRSRVIPLVEQLRVDGSRDDVAFFNITAAGLGPDGNLYVLDVGNNQVLVIDGAGTLVRVVGRRGQGPGEFSGPRTMWLTGDTIAVGDSGNRVHFFRTDGTILATRAYLDVSDDDDFWSLGALVGTPEGWLTTASAYFRNDAGGNETRLAPLLRIRLLRLNDAGSIDPTGFHLEHEPLGQWVAPYFVQPPFVQPPMLSVDGLGRVHVVRSGDYVIDVHSSSGTLLYTVRNEIERDRVTRADLNQWREDRACTAETPECDESRTELALSLPIPEYQPVVGRLVAFHKGHLAVMRRGTDPDPNDRLAMGEYDMFDPTGSFLGRLPLGLSPRWFDGETLVATEWNELMVPTMLVLRVSN